MKVTCSDGSSFDAPTVWRATLLDAHRHSTEPLVLLYHERWEYESAYYALRHTIGHGRVLRSMDPEGVEKEVWALLHPASNCCAV